MLKMKQVWIWFRIFINFAFKVKSLELPKTVCKNYLWFVPGFALFKAKLSDILYTVAKIPALTTSQMAKIRQCLSSPHHNACITVECLHSIQVLGWMGWDGIFCGSGVARGLWPNIFQYFYIFQQKLSYIGLHRGTSKTKTVLWRICIGLRLTFRRNELERWKEPP